MGKIRLKTERISSNIYVWQEIGKYTLFVIFMLLLFLFVPGKDGVSSYLGKFITSTWIFILGYILIIVNLVLGIYFVIWKLYKRGYVYFSDESILLNKIELRVTYLENLEVRLNPLKYKSRDGRTIFNGGGNNWVLFKHEGKNFSIEFLLKTKEDEDLFKEIISRWKTYQKSIKVGVAKEHLLLSLFDKEDNY